MMPRRDSGALKRSHSRLAAVFALCLLAGPAAEAAVPPPIAGQRGAVAADHPLASQAGVTVLKRGGNAVDAVCAAAFALGVVNPAGSGLGGGGFMLIKPAGKSEPVALDFRETAPKAATRDMFLGQGKSASRGGLAVGVPGELMGCAMAIKRFGKLPLRAVLAPAIRLARRGFSLGPYLSSVIAKRQDWITKDPLFARMFAPRGGKVLRTGDRARRRRLGRALQAIARDGTRVFRSGWIARDIVKAVERSGGVLALDDLAGYQPKWRKPLHLRYAAHNIYMMPPPSSGGIVMIQVMNILQRYDLAGMGQSSSRYLHHLTEAFKHAFADRARFLGDADFVRLPLARLTSRAYADELAARIGRRVGPSSGYGSKTLPKAPKSDGGTSHISVIDKTGLAVALTTSINTSFGSRVVAPKSGIILNNTMADFASRPGKPNIFGLVQGEANAIAPGKRPLSSMSPTIVCKEGRAVLAAGGSGGPTIITATLQALLNTLVFRLDATEAVSRSRIHHQWLPDILWVEEDLPRDVVDNLKRRGHKIKLVKRPPMPSTAVQLVVDVGGATGSANTEKPASTGKPERSAPTKPRTLTAASDPRKLGAPAVH